MNIQWYPGHMAKAKRLILEDISLVDIVIELLDARIPLSSRNPDIDGLAKNKHRIIALNKSDLADNGINGLWREYFEAGGYRVVMTDCLKGAGLNEISQISKEMMAEKTERNRKRGRLFTPIRAMIAGVPNVGKSTLINKYSGKAIAQTGDRPGVTKAKQWIKIKDGFELLDTPGILWPKFDDEKVGLNLGFTGAVKDDILDAYTLAVKFIDSIREIKPQALAARYGISFDDGEKSTDILVKVAEKRGFILKGGLYDVNRAGIILIDEFRGGKLGRISLERP